MSGPTDRVYALPMQRVGDFVFDDQVADVFPDMIRRSVPGYGSIVSMTAELAAVYCPPGGVIYDLGCSLGACTLPMASALPRSCTIHAIDSSEAMMHRLTGNLKELRPNVARVQTRTADIVDVAFESCQFVVLNFTLQFVPVEQREELVGRIANAIQPGGALIVSEKICFPDQAEQQLMTDLHHAFKRANGYSELEIAQKRSALENSLYPESLESHQARLLSAGFRSVSAWFRCFNFVSMIAVK